MPGNHLLQSSPFDKAKLSYQNRHAMSTMGAIRGSALGTAKTLPIGRALL